MSKTIWYCNHYAIKPELASYRPYYLSSSLNTLGAKVTVIAASHHHLHTHPLEFNESYKKQNYDGVNYLWVKAPQYSGNGFARLKNMWAYANFLKSTNLVQKGILEKPDVIVVSSVHMLHFKAMKKWAKIYNAKLIFEVRDIWPLTLNELVGVSRLHPLSLYLSYLEKYSYKHADKVISILPNALEYMMSKGLKEEKFHHIPNGIIINDQAAQKVEAPTELTFLKDEGKFIVFYCGSHGTPNALSPLIEAAELLKGNVQIHFILLGKGQKKQELIDQAQKAKLNNISFLDAVPASEVKAYLHFADIAYLGWNKSKLYQHGVSANKIFEYMLAAKPILQSIDSPNNPVELAKCGRCIPPMDPQAIAGAIIAFSEMDRMTLEEIGLKGFNYLQLKHNYQHLAQQYLDIINDRA